MIEKMIIKDNDDLMLAITLRNLMIKHKQYDKAATLTETIVEYVRGDAAAERSYNGEKL